MRFTTSSSPTRLFFTIALFTTLLLTQTEATSCMSSALINVKLAAYAVRALAYGVPRNAVWCVHRAVRAERMQEVSIGDKRVSCMSSKRLATVIGTSLPNCVVRHGGAHRGTAATAAAAARRPVTVSSELVRTSERTIAKMTNLRLPFVSRMGCNQDNWCHCYCNSGCHYCCSSAGVGLPGSPSFNCFKNIGCAPRHLQVCPK